MPPRRDPTKGKAPAVPQSTAPDQGPSAPIRSSPSSNKSSPRALQLQADLSKDLATQMENLATPSSPQEDTGLAERIAAAVQQALTAEKAQTARLNPKPAQPISPPPIPLVETKLPAVPQITKLKGRVNYRTWIHEIQSSAKTYRVWDAIVNPDTLLPDEYQAFAFSLIYQNTVQSIQSALTAYTTALEAWQYLSEQYNQLNIAQLSKEVQDLASLDYNSFSLIESF